MKRIIIETAASEDQRYPTAGDYWETDNEIYFKITDQGSDDHEFLVAIHEMIEFWLTRERGISEAEITDYDIKWEELPEPKADEPGNEADCIYGREHRFAENIERQLAHELGIDWHEYNNSLKI